MEYGLGAMPDPQADADQSATSTETQQSDRLLSSKHVYPMFPIEDYRYLQSRGKNFNEVHVDFRISIAGKVLAQLSIPHSH